MKHRNNKIELSLSALMFFSPLIKNLLKKTSLLKHEKEFINWYIKLWYINIILLALTILSQILFYMSKSNIYNVISIILSVILWTLLVIWSIYAIWEKEIFKSNVNSKANTDDIVTIISYYIPIYNIYLWYKKHEFESPNLIIKESILLWGLFNILFLITYNSSLIIIIFFIIILRVLSLKYNLQSSISNKYNKWLTNIFKKNPEELWAYIKVVFLFKDKTEVKTKINNSKLKFELIPKLSNKKIVFQYILLCIIVLLLLYCAYKLNNTNLIIGSILLILRYLIMIVQWKHVPNLPLLMELSNLFFKNKNEN